MDNNNFNGRKNQGASPMATSRARNRTVMLSSDLTDQVRSLIQSTNVTNDELVEAEDDTRSDFVAPMMFESTFSKFDNNDSVVDRSEKVYVPSVKEILTTQEHSKSHQAVSSDASTLVHKQSSNFNAERENLLKRSPSQSVSRIYGFLISFDKDESGEIFDVREGRSIVSSRHSDQGVVINILDESVSAPHAVLKASKGGQILVLDQLSESGTGVLKNGTSEEVNALGNPVELRHGDILRFGARYFVFCAVPKIAIQD